MHTSFRRSVATLTTTPAVSHAIKNWGTLQVTNRGVLFEGTVSKLPPIRYPKLSRFHEPTKLWLDAYYHYKKNAKGHRYLIEAVWQDPVTQAWLVRISNYDSARYTSLVKDITVFKAFFYMIEESTKLIPVIQEVDL